MSTFLKNNHFFKKWTISGKPEKFFKKSGIFRKTHRVKFYNFAKNRQGKKSWFSRFLIQKSQKFKLSSAPAGVLENHRFRRFMGGTLSYHFGSFLSIIFDEKQPRLFRKTRGFLKNDEFLKNDQFFKKWTISGKHEEFLKNRWFSGKSVV